MQTALVIVDRYSNILSTLHIRPQTEHFLRKSVLYKEHFVIFVKKYDYGHSIQESYQVDYSNKDNLLQVSLQRY